MKVLKGDKVKILSGKYRGKDGEVLSVFPKQEKVLVKGINIVTKHLKNRGEGKPAGIVKEEAPIHVSNVQVLNEAGKPSRVKFEIKDGVKTRVFKKKK